MHFRSELSSTSLAVGTRSKTQMAPATLLLVVGSRVVIAKDEEVDAIWAQGQVIAQVGDSTIASPSVPPASAPTPLGCDSDRVCCRRY